MKKMISLLLALSCLTVTNAYSLTLNEAQGIAYDATCRVNVSNAVGTGVVIGFDESINKYLVLTNYHVVTNNKTAICDFWLNGKLTSCQGTVVWKYFNNSIPADFCIIGIDRDFVERNKITNVPLAGNESVNLNNAFFVSAGCPKGIHTGAWKGVITKKDNTVEFKPAPYPGQSGSGIFEIINDELWYVGTLTWLVGREGASSSKGAYIPVTNLYEALNIQKYPASFEKEREPWVAPANYTECADERSIRVIEITTQNCPACTKALSDVNNLLDSGVDVSSIDIIDCDDEMKKKYKADKFPTFALIDKEGNVVDVWYGFGKSGDILGKIKNLEDADSFSEEEPAEPVINEDITGTLVEDPQEEYIVSDDFRDRENVIEEYEDVSFFEDSKSNWEEKRNRKKQEIKEKEQKAKVETKKNEAAVNGNLATRLGNEFEQRSDKIGSNLLGKVDSLFTDKKESLKTEISEYFNEIKSRIFWFFVAVVFVGNLFVAVFVDFVKVVFGKFFKFSYKVVSNGIKHLKDVDKNDKK